MGNENNHSEPAGRSSIGYTRDFCFVLWFRYNLSHTHPKSMAAPTKLPSMPTIGRRHLESQSREKGKLNFTCIWQGKAWQLLCTLLKHVLMLFCAINWKIQPFPEILPPFSSFFNYPRLTLVSLLKCDDIRRDAAVLRLSASYKQDHVHQ